MEAFEQAEPGQKKVITMDLSISSNLRTQAHRIIKRAGLTPWGKTFQNLRSSRETELVEDFPIHVVTEWLGNSPDVARKHYLQTHEEHFKRAVGAGGLNMGLTTAARSRIESPNENSENPESQLIACGATSCDATPHSTNSDIFYPVPPRGVEPLLPG